MIINQIQYKDTDIEISATKSEITWSMQIKDKRYGNTVVLPDKKINTLIGTVASLVVNAIETFEAIKLNSAK
jgi:hypothetical protein